MICNHCKRELPVQGKVAVRDTCPGCNEALHSCVNCTFWNPPVGRCREPAAEWIGERRQGNYCEFFQAIAPPKSAAMSSDQAKQAFENLFRKA